MTIFKYLQLLEQHASEKFLVKKCLSRAKCIYNIKIFPANTLILTKNLQKSTINKLKIFLITYRKIKFTKTFVRQKIFIFSGGKRIFFLIILKGKKNNVKI